MLLDRAWRVLFRSVQRAPGNIVDALKRARAEVHPSPVIVLGNQKSGTTAIAVLLAGLADCSVTLDIFFRFRRPVLRNLLCGAWSLEDFIRKYPFWFSTKIIKEPSLTFFYDDLRACFPNARFVFIIRDPRDNIRSILDRLKIPGNLSRLHDHHLASFPRNKGWRLILDGTLFKTAGETYIDTLARRWSCTAELAFENRENLVLVRYEDFVTRKVETITELAEAVGLTPARSIADRVDIQYQPRGHTDVAWADFFGEKNLQLIESVCLERMRDFGYEPSLTTSESPAPTDP